MAYCTKNDILTRIDEKVLVNLTNDIPKYGDNLPTEVNESILSQMIEISDDMINASLRNRYTLPLNTTPKIINQISADITIYRLYARRPQDVPKNYQKNFEDAIQLLKEFQNGSKILDAGADETFETLLTPNMYMCDKTEEDRKFNGGFTLWALTHR